MIQTINALQAYEKLTLGAILIDIRSTAEYKREHITNAIQCTVDQLKQHGLPQNHATEIIFCCKSGVRTQLAQPIFENLTTNASLFMLEHGIDGWKKAGLPTYLDDSQPIDIMRQVQIIAGTLILTGAILGWFVSPLFYLLCAFIGVGLLFAGLTGFCGLARVLAHMPWNKV